MLDLDAGKYAPYVWPAYAITVLVFGWLIGDSLLRARRWRLAVGAQEDDLASEAREDAAESAKRDKDAAE